MHPPSLPLLPPLTLVGANQTDENTETAVRYGILDGREPVLKRVGARPRRRLEQELAAFI